MGVSGQLHAPVALLPEKDPASPNCIGVWMGLRAGLDAVEKRKILHYRDRTQAVRPVVRRYTDWAVPTHLERRNVT
jgi:hypothetical protein